MTTGGNAVQRRPANLAEAPDYVTVVQTAAAMGLSEENIYKLEATDPTFPKRQKIPFSKVTKFDRLELLAWVAARRNVKGLAS